MTAAEPRQIVIDPRFHGPPDSANGGYVAGLVAQALGAPSCKVVLKRPPPLNHLIDIDRQADRLTLVADGVPIATGEPHVLQFDVPTPPTLAQARDAEAGFAGLRRHVYPGCFVCGPDRAAGDGLRIFAGPLEGRAGQVAAAWQPGDDLSDDTGHVALPFVWAALDCPGYFAVEQEAGRALLGTIIGHVMRPVPVGEPLVVIGWRAGGEGRKHRVGTALFDTAGALLACAEATWISMR